MEPEKRPCLGWFSRRLRLRCFADRRAELPHRHSHRRAGTHLNRSLTLYSSKASSLNTTSALRQLKRSYGGKIVLCRAVESGNFRNISP